MTFDSAPTMGVRSPHVSGKLIHLLPEIVASQVYHRCFIDQVHSRANDGNGVWPLPESVLLPVRAPPYVGLIITHSEGIFQ